MIINLFNNSIAIKDEQQSEIVEIDNYQAAYTGISSGIYIFNIVKDCKNIITVRSNNLVIIDNRNG